MDHVLLLQLVVTPIALMVLILAGWLADQVLRPDRRRERHLDRD
jgi:hypothetical protein